MTSVIDGLLVMANNAGDIDLENQESPSDGSGLIVLGLGKLGGNELNYSSDIDLIVLYDLECCRLTSSIEPRDFFVRLSDDVDTFKKYDGQSIHGNIRDKSQWTLPSETFGTSRYVLYDLLGYTEEEIDEIKKENVTL